MSTSNETISEYLNQYLALERPGFAVLLKGDWGCGKTWFMNDFIEKYVSQQKKFDENTRSGFLKMSLNGINSTESIDRRIFFALHPKLKNEYTDLFAHLASGILALAKVDSLLKAFKLKDFTHAIKGKVLIFDDLERCCLPAAETLGYLSDFIERMGLHVILIANEDQIETVEEVAGKDRVTKYALIKEKVIGRRLEVIHDIESVLKHFISKLSSLLLKDELKKRIQLITDIFDKSDCRNLRILLHTLIDFERLWSKLSEDQKKVAVIFEKLLITLLCLKFDFDKARISASDIKSIEGYRLHQLMQNKRDPDETPPRIATTFDRYPWIDSYHTVLSAAAWSTYFGKGYVSKETVQECIEKSGLMPQGQSPLVSLWYWSDIEDADLDKLVTNIIKELESLHITSPFQILHVAGILIRLSSYGILEISLLDISKKIETVVDNLFDSESLEYAHPYDLQSDHACWGSLTFQANETSEFKKLKQHVIGKMLIADNRSMAETAKNIPELILTDMKTFIKTINYNSEKQLYYNKPVLALVDPKRFFESVVKLPNRLKWNTFHALEERYETIMNNEVLAKEIDFLQSIHKLTLDYIANNKGRNSVLQLEGASKKHLEKAIRTVVRFIASNERDIENNLQCDSHQQVIGSAAE